MCWNVLSHTERFWRNVDAQAHPA